MKIKTITFLFFAFIASFLFIGCSFTKNKVAFSEFISNPEDIRIKNRAFEQVPTVGASADGKQIFVGWYSGGPAPGPGNYITVSISLDAGKSWLNDQLVIYPKFQTYRFFDPLIWRDNKGRIQLFYGSSKGSLLWDGFGGVNSVFLKWNGNQISVSKPTRFTNGVMSNKPIYLDFHNKTLFPVYVDKPINVAISDKPFPQNGVFIYTNGLKSDSFERYSSIEIEDELRIHDEPQIVEISNSGQLLAMLRTTKGIYFTNSNDYGKSWSKIKAFTAVGPTTSSRFYLGKLSSGNLLLITNNSTTRNKMTAFLSKDGGKTWPHKLLLDARENVSYPDADQTTDGNIHVVFDRERTGAKDILYCKFKEDDLISGNINHIFKTRVNK